MKFIKIKSNQDFKDFLLWLGLILYQIHKSLDIIDKQEHKQNS